MRFAVNVTAKLAERRSVRLPVSAALLLSAGKQSEHLDKVKSRAALYLACSCNEKPASSNGTSEPVPWHRRPTRTQVGFLSMTAGTRHSDHTSLGWTRLSTNAEAHVTKPGTPYHLPSWSWSCRLYARQSGVKAAPQEQ